MIKNDYKKHFFIKYFAFIKYSYTFEISKREHEKL